MSLLRAEKNRRVFDLAALVSGGFTADPNEIVLTFDRPIGISSPAALSLFLVTSNDLKTALAVTLVSWEQLTPTTISTIWSGAVATATGCGWDGEEPGLLHGSPFYAPVG